MRIDCLPACSLRSCRPRELAGPIAALAMMEASPLSALGTLGDMRSRALALGKRSMSAVWRCDHLPLHRALKMESDSFSPRSEEASSTSARSLRLISGESKGSDSACG